MREPLIRITTSRVCGGVICNPAPPLTVRETAPYFNFMRGWTYLQVFDYGRGRGWQVEEVPRVIACAGCGASIHVLHDYDTDFCGDCWDAADYGPWT